MSTEDKLADELSERARIAITSRYTGKDAALDLRAASAISRLSAEVQELRAALRPFAEAGGQVPTGHGPDNEPVSDDEPVTMSVVGFLVGDVTAADLARARAALKPETGK